MLTAAEKTSRQLGREEMRLREMLRKTETRGQEKIIMKT